MKPDRELYEATAKLRTVEAQLAVQLEIFGDYLAEREGYRQIHSLDAIHFYIIHKFKWIPSQVRAMTFEDLRFILTEEMSGWTVPKELRNLCPTAHND